MEYSVKEETPVLLFFCFFFWLPLLDVFRTGVCFFLVCTFFVLIHFFSSFLLLLCFVFRSSTCSSMMPSWRRVCAVTQPSRPISCVQCIMTWTVWILRPTPAKLKRSSEWVFLCLTLCQHQWVGMTWVVTSVNVGLCCHTDSEHGHSDAACWGLQHCSAAQEPWEEPVYGCATTWPLPALSYHHWWREQQLYQCCPDGCKYTNTPTTCCI